MPDHKTIADQSNQAAAQTPLFNRFFRFQPVLTGSGRGSGVLLDNVQVAVETENHLIVTHEVTMSGSDRSHLARVGKAAKAVMRIVGRPARRVFTHGAIGPQCGFASTAAGNPLSLDDERAKLRLLVNSALAIWS